MLVPAFYLRIEVCKSYYILLDVSSSLVVSVYDSNILLVERNLYLRSSDSIES
jgi:hypothetical protein